jgi:uncharacterized UPF0160 family protein
MEKVYMSIAIGSIPFKIREIDENYDNPNLIQSPLEFISRMIKMDEVSGTPLFSDEIINLINVVVKVINKNKTDITIVHTCLDIIKTINKNNSSKINLDTINNIEEILIFIKDNISQKIYFALYPYINDLKRFKFVIEL